MNLVFNGNTESPEGKFNGLSIVFSRRPLLALAILNALFIQQFASGLQPSTNLNEVKNNLRTGSPKTALDAYLEKQDDAYQWKKIDSGKIGRSSYAGLILTSQKWRGMVWKHQLYVIKPASCPADCQQGLLFIGGGSWNKNLETSPGRLPGEATQLAKVAEQLKCPIAVLRQVPNQPIFDGRYEDEIIALTFDRFVQTGEQDWPLLLPMVKSAHRALDASIEYARQEWKLNLKKFTVTGASKRGWTTWLTGATDIRVNAIAPMVIDVLNMKPQMEHQKLVWGEFSDEIGDYTERGLQDLLSSDKGKKLLEIVDPYSYRSRIQQPKLIFIGTNDAYWPIDALQFYWGDLQNEKYICYVPNNGHDIKDFSRLIGSLHGFQMMASGKQKMPSMSWRYENGRDDTVKLTLSCKEKPDQVQLWTATSKTRDFRKATWKSRMINRDENDCYCVTVSKPDSGCMALFGEGIFARDNFPCYLSTNVKVLQAD